MTRLAAVVKESTSSGADQASSAGPGAGRCEACAAPGTGVRRPEGGVRAAAMSGSMVGGTLGLLALVVGVGVGVVGLSQVGGLDQRISQRPQRGRRAGDNGRAEPHDRLG